MSAMRSLIWKPKAAYFGSGSEPPDDTVYDVCSMLSKKCQNNVFMKSIMMSVSTETKDLEHLVKKFQEDSWFTSPSHFQAFTSCEMTFFEPFLCLSLWLSIDQVTPVA